MYRLIPANRNNSLYRMFDALEQEMCTPVTAGASFRTDILEKDDCYELQAELPGFSKDQIKLNLEEGVLTIEASRETQQDGNYLRRERKTGTFARSFNVSGVRESDISASFHDGVLTLTLPKQTPAAPARHEITIE